MWSPIPISALNYNKPSKKTKTSKQLCAPSKASQSKNQSQPLFSNITPSIAKGCYYMIKPEFAYQKDLSMHNCSMTITTHQLQDIKAPIELTQSYTNSSIGRG